MPAPNVDSAVIRLEIKDNDTIKANNEKFLFSLVKSAFSQRRKTLANPVSSGLNIPKSVVVEALEKVGLKSTVRAEQVPFEKFIELSNVLGELK